MSKEETVEVTVKIPKQLLKLLEAEHYFGWTKEDFWTSAVQGQIGVAANAMHHKKAKRLYQKYGRDIDIVYLPEGLEP